MAVRFSPGKCFYCGVGFNKVRRGQKGMRATNPTIDHVYPVGAKLPPKLAAHPIGSPRLSVHNRVRACFSCNNLKGDLHPLLWLTLCPSDAGAEALANLLLVLGEKPTPIHRALHLRSSTAPNLYLQPKEGIPK